MQPLDKGSRLSTFGCSLLPPLSRTTASYPFQTLQSITSLLRPPQGQLTGHQEATLASIQSTQVFPLTLHSTLRFPVYDQPLG